MKIVLLDSLLSPQIVVAVSQAENIADSAEVVLPIFGKFLTQEMACSVPGMRESPTEKVGRQIFGALEENGISGAEQGEPTHQPSYVQASTMLFDQIVQPFGVSHFVVIGEHRG